MSPPLLVIAYKFPPYAGVGGFRWAKLSKYLARLGHEVHVVTVPWRGGGPNTLVADAYRRDSEDGRSEQRALCPAILVST